MANKPSTKSEVYAYISERTDLKKKQVSAVFDALTELISRDLKRGPGVFNVPGLMKIKMVHKPAVPERKGINPFTGEETMFKAKPATTAVKIRPLKKMKEFANS